MRAVWIAIICSTPIMLAQQAAVPPLPVPLNLPKPAPATNEPYQPQPILEGGIVVPLYPANSPLLDLKRVREPEVYTMSASVPGRISNIVNIHNPSIEIHPADAGNNTGAGVILIPGGGHNFLNVASEGADFVPFFRNYGVTTVILRNRLRKDGYDVQKDALHDTLQAIRMVRAHATELKLDPHRIGIMGFSAGGELSSYASVEYESFDKENSEGDPLAGVTARPDFVTLVYPGPTPFAPGRTAPALPRNMPPVFVVSSGSDDQSHALYSSQYFTALLTQRVPDVEMHVYAIGRHPGEVLRDGSHMTGGLSDRHDNPFGAWQYRFIDWFRDLGFLEPPGVETKAAKDMEYFLNQPKQ